MLEKKYNHLEVEKNKYKNWKEKGYFKADNKSDKTPCSISAFMTSLFSAPHSLSSFSSKA